MEKKEVVFEFPASVCQGGRITIPWIYREKYDIDQGTRVLVTVKIDED